MMYLENGLVVLENDRVRIEIASDDSKVMSVFDKKSSRDIKGEDTYFFYLIESDGETVAVPDKLDIVEDVVKVKTLLGDFSVEILSEADFFTFELTSSLPEDAYKLVMGEIKYAYDPSDKNNTGAAGVAMTYWANPCFFPDAKACITKAEVIRHLKDKGAKYALVIAPICEHKEILKAVMDMVDKRYGIKTHHGGVYSCESELNFGNSIITTDISEEYLKENLELLKTLGVDQLDIHKGKKSFWQGDFSYIYHKDDTDFKADVVELLEKNGITAGLHTYSSYIDYDCVTMLSDPECQKDFGVLEVFTLKEDIDKDADFVPTVESTVDVSGHYGFFTRNTPYILIGEEMIEFENAPDGFKVKKRGACGTKAVCHSKGDMVKHIDGYYHGVSPVMGSELFFKIARNTAKTFDAAGFKTIYLDALDGIGVHCKKDEMWFYLAAFVCEVIANCEREPMIEASTTCPALWASRGRFGAYDTVSRGYKHWNDSHNKYNRMYTDRYATATLGWYDFYPIWDKDPGNVHTKYEHTDYVHHLGSIALTSNFCIVFVDVLKEDLEKIPALRRNVAIYRMYDELRKKKYFSEETIEKVRKGSFEYHIEELNPGEFVFVEKDFQTVKLYDLNDENRNCGKFSNPFGKQTPFVRVEALLSGKKGEGVELLAFDENRDFNEQSCRVRFEKEIDLKDKLAKTVTVWGNGRKGSAVAIRLQCGTDWGRSYFEFFIDTDFEGKREFVLVESDNGQRADLPFDKMATRKADSSVNNETDPDEFEEPACLSCMEGYAVYRTNFFHDRTAEIDVIGTKDAKGVRLSPVRAVEHSFETLENPSVIIGDSMLVFECALKSTDFIEFDGNCAKVIDRYGNEKEVSYHGELLVPAGDFCARLCAENAGVVSPLRAQLTFGFSGEKVK